MRMFKAYFPFLFLVLLMLLSTDVDAQCAMCKAQAETTLQEGNKDITGLNLGILYLFFAPYAIIATVWYLWKKNKKVS